MTGAVGAGLFGLPRLDQKNGHQASACRNAGLSAPFPLYSLQFGRVATILTFVEHQSGKSATFGVQSTRKEVPGVTVVSCSADI